MKKAFFIILFLSTLLNGSVLDQKIESIIGKKDFALHKNLINLIFKDQGKFTYQNSFRYYNIFKTLKDNGLLNLRLNKPQEITLEFKGLNKPVKSYKILKDILHVLGYRYFFTEEFSLEENKAMVWKIRLKAEYMVDPVILLKELQQKNCKITNVEKEQNNWSYEIDFEKAILNEAKLVEKNEKVKFQKPLKDYFLMVDEAKSLQIISRKLNNWYPYIVFFDNDLNTLKLIKKNRVYRGYKTKVPKGTKYIKITDMFNLINIKRGLSVIVR